MITQLAEKDKAIIIDAGDEGVLLALNVDFSTVFMGRVYDNNNNVFLCTLMCRRETATTHEFMTELSSVLLKFKCTNFKVQPIAIEKGTKTETAEHYLLCPGIHGVHSRTDDELIDNLTLFFGVAKSQLQLMKRFSPGNYLNRASKITVYKDGQAAVARVRHLQNPPRYRQSTDSACFLSPPLMIGPATVNVNLHRKIYVGMDQAKIIKIGESGVLWAEDMHVCSVFVGTIYRHTEYQGTIMCRRGVGTVNTFADSINRALREYPDQHRLIFKPRLIQTCGTPETIIYKVSCGLTGKILPKPEGQHARTDDELISNLSFILRLKESELKSVIQPIFGINKIINGCKAEISGTGNINYSRQESIRNVATATVTASTSAQSTPPEVIDLTKD